MVVMNFLNRRWLVFFLILFVTWYPVSFFIVTIYQATENPILLFIGNIFTPLWILLISYLYFRRARNDWPARFVTAIGWMALLFLFSALLARPVYGYDWTSVVNWDVVNANWINVVAIIVGGIAAHRSTSFEKSIP